MADIVSLPGAASEPIKQARRLGVGGRMPKMVTNLSNARSQRMAQESEAGRRSLIDHGKLVGVAYSGLHWMMEAILKRRIVGLLIIYRTADADERLVRMGCYENNPQAVAAVANGLLEKFLDDEEDE